MLYRDVAESLQRKYAELFRRAIPNLVIDPRIIEIVDHGLSDGDADQNFLDCGLGISVREIYDRPIETTRVGFTGKLLGWLPGQFMPEHRHRDLLAVPKGEDLGELCNKLVRLESLVSGFSGLAGFDNLKYDFFTQESDGVTIDFYSSWLPRGSIIIPGKAETFDIIYGDGSFFSSGNETISPRYGIPKSQKPYVSHRRELYLGAGQQLKLPPNTPHSARAGSRGMVAIEYSMPSRDEADIFTDPRIKRKTEIMERR